MIYLDNAATTFPKPECLVREIKKCINSYGGNPGRSGHFLSLKASEKIYDCRETLASFFGSSYPENVIFTLNTTYALNIAIKCLYVRNSHVLISNMEHNSVFRPINRLKEMGEIDYSVFDVMQKSVDIIDGLEKKIRYNTKMLIMTHSSNICGKIFPIREIGNFCKKRGIIFIVDAAQSAGVVNINVERDNINALCAPAHKGLYGPQGLGFVIFNNTLPIRTILEGGNGVDSLSPYMGNIFPESYEAGTMATPLIAGLSASVKWLQRNGIESINQHERELAYELGERLQALPGSVIYGPQIPETGILLYGNTAFSLDNIYHEICKKNICTRNGFHCAPMAHRTLKTSDKGAIRFSFGYFNTQRDIDDTYKTIIQAIK